jgi:4-amino-4-deoxy-L-arabinose transferase-like glycosyltransferase
MKPDTQPEDRAAQEKAPPCETGGDAWPFLLGLLLFSLACRLVLLQFKDLVGTDESIYLALGKNVWHGLGFRLLDHPITLCPPLLPIVAGFFSLFTEDLEIGTNFTYVVFGGCTVLPYFCLARRIYGTRVARRASFFLAFFPGLLLSFFWGSMTEPLYTFLLITALLFVHRALQEDRPLDFCLAGGLLGLVYLARSEGIVFGPVLFSFAVLSFARRGTLVRKRTLRNLCLLLAVYLGVSAPYPLFIKKSSGELSISGKTKLILLVGNMDLKTRESLAGRLSEDGSEFFDYAGLVEDKTVLGMILENPKVLVGGSFLQFRNFFVTLMSWKVFPAFLFGFVLLGLFRDPWDRTRLRDEVFLLTACLPFLVFLTFRIWPRYLLPMTPLLLLWGARGVTSLEDWTRQSLENIRRKKAPMAWWLSWAPAVLFALPLLVILVAKPVKSRMLVQYPVEYRAAGEWMARNLPPEAMLLARKPEIAYYAKRLMHPIPNEELPAIVRYARRKDIGYLVVDEYFIATRPQLQFLLEGEGFPPDLLFLHEERAANGRKLRVFQIRSEPPDGVQ